jgi:hypothetical protein
MVTRIIISPYSYGSEASLLKLSPVMVTTICGAFVREYSLSWSKLVALLKATPADSITVELK